MKKTLFIVAGTLILSVGVSILNSMNSNSSFDIFTSNVDALTDEESICTSSSGKNKGHCEALLDGSGDVCVVKSWLERGNCSGNITID